MEEKSNIRNENPILEKLKRETDIMQSELKIKTASGGKQSLKNSMDGKLKLDHLDRRQLLDKQESQQQVLKLFLRNPQNVFHALDFPKILFDQRYSLFLCRIGIIIHNPDVYLCTTNCAVVVVFW